MLEFELDRDGRFLFCARACAIVTEVEGSILECREQARGQRVIQPRFLALGDPGVGAEPDFGTEGVQTTNLEGEVVRVPFGTQHRAGFLPVRFDEYLVDVSIVLETGRLDANPAFSCAKFDPVASTNGECHEKQHENLLSA